MLENRRAELLDGLRRFVFAVRDVAGVRRISLVGSIVTTKPDPKDIDVLLIVSDDADLAALAVHARRLQGHAQTFNRGADVFLADEHGSYLGRTCRWRECRPGIRQSCGARHCGRRPHLHDDFDAVVLSKDLIAAPPLTLWPAVERRVQLPPDLEEVVSASAKRGSFAVGRVYGLLVSSAPDAALIDSLRQIEEVEMGRDVRLRDPEDSAPSE